MTVWCLTTGPDNFDKTAELGWKIQGIKSRRRPTAAQLRPGDKLVYYITEVAAFGGIVEVTSEYFEDHELHWTSKPGEDYPWRVEIAPEIVIEDRERWVPADHLRDALEFPRKWPVENWKLAFQGNIRAWPEADYRTVRKALQRAAKA